MFRLGVWIEGIYMANNVWQEAKKIVENNRIVPNKLRILGFSLVL